LLRLWLDFNRIDNDYRSILFTYFKDKNNDLFYIKFFKINLDYISNIETDKVESADFKSLR